jgi:hypothetical protein
MASNAVGRRSVHQHKGAHVFINKVTRNIVVRSALFASVLGSAAVLAQQTPATTASSAMFEFPVIMRQSVSAGSTPVGTKVQAQLIAATLVDGVVIPRDAILSGQVTESAKKSKTDPSRLSIRLDVAQWKSGSAPIKVYLTAWYYPEVMAMGQDPSYQPQDAANSKRTWNGQGAYPDPSNPVSQQKFPGGRGSDKDSVSTPGSTASNISKHRVLMKNIESSRDGDGAVALTSTHTNIKIDKLTTYVFAPGDLRSMN